MSERISTDAGAPAAPPLLGTGTVVGSRYLVRRVVGRGAFALVYEAAHADLGQRVALKTARVDGHALIDLHGAAERYRREAALCAKIKSAHVPRVHDLGRLPDGCPYLVMEFLDGQRLDSVLGQAPLPLHVAVAVTRHVLLGLDAVHRTRNIHRDVKPQNVMLSHDESGRLLAKLFDFGICKPLDESRPDLTLDGLLVGTPHYMAPEQARGDLLDERVDVYAAGVVLYEMLTTRLPFEAGDAQDVLRAVLHAPFLPPSVLRPDCPPELERVVMRALARPRGERYASALAMLDDLEHVEAAVTTRARVPELSRTAGSVGRPPRDTQQTRSASLEAPPRGAEAEQERAQGPRRAARPWLALALTLGAIAAGAGWYLTL